MASSVASATATNRGDREGRSGTRRARECTLREAAQVAVAERRICGDDNHQRAVGSRWLGILLEEALPEFDAGNTRELVPIPPFQPNASVPVPAPTAPSATGPEFAASIACKTSSRLMTRFRISFNVPSLVSPTAGLMERACSLPGCASVQAMIPSAAWGTLRVLVRTIGVSIPPSS